MKRLWTLILVFVAVVGAAGNAQTLHVRLLDGRTGKPIGKGGINVWVGDNRKAAVPISGDANGIAKLSLINNAEQAKIGAERPSELPTFLYAAEIRVQVGLVLCQAAEKKFSWLKITPYSTDDWARTGIVTANTCGKAVAKSEPGELTIFVRPLTFWEGMSQ
jgi:hypothetical protein